ncbi:hypothetical protein LCGC14_1604360 [marine sediment metagenome]|uniref:Uncharacterized protein n=1 Tax=marine sediment metagenome TaxID=412755 RepID=A0A0F9LA94_9ZZZZ
MDDDTVQKDSVSEGTESDSVAEPTVAEQITQGIATAMDSVMPRLRQSIHDTVKSETSRSQPEGGIPATVKEALGGLTLESGEPVSKYLDAADKDAQLRAYQEAEQRSKAEQQRTTEAAQVYYGFLDESGIGREDPRLDWAREEPDPKKALNRWYASIAKIKGETVKEVKGDAPKADGTDFVDTAQTTGTKSFSIPAKKEDFGPWLDKLPYSVYKEHKEEIEAAHNSGQMK